MLKAIMKKKMVFSNTSYKLLSLLFLLFLFSAILIPQTVYSTACSPPSSLCANMSQGVANWCDDVKCEVHTHHIDYCLDGTFYEWDQYYCYTCGWGYCYFVNGCDFSPHWWFAAGTDVDGDGHQAIGSCGVSPIADDCDDNDPNNFQGNTEVCDGKDNNCDGQIDEGFENIGDPFNPNSQEICDGIDNNCNGQIDETCYGDDCRDIPIGSSASLASGNLYHSQQVSGLHSTGLSANITISYNSLDTTIGSLGRGWMHNYNISITEHGTKLILIEADGKRVYFSSTDGITYSPDTSSGSYSTITKNIDGTYTLTEKSGVEYDFDSSGRLISITDRNNNTLTFTYTGYNLTLITNSDGRQTILAYNANNRITSITDPLGRTTTLTYNGNKLSTVTDPLGATWTYTYDTNGRMFTKTDPLGRTTTYSYDANRKIISSIDSEGNTKTISYDQTNNTAYVTEKNGAQWAYKYNNTLNVPTEVTDPSANKTTYQYDSNRNLISKTEPGTVTTKYTYDTDGNMLTKTEAYGSTNQRTITYTYNSFGQALTVTDPDGNITSYTYDANGNLIQETDAQGNITAHTYNSYGQKLLTTDPNGNITTFTYDQYGNLASTANALNQTTTYTYDIMGNLLSMTDANGNTTTYEYDLRDRLIRETKPDGGIIDYEYDLAGNRTAITDANGNRTTYTYDSLNRLTELRTPNAELTAYTYDSEGNMTSMIIKDSSNNVKTSGTYTYDIYNRLIRTTNADGTYTEQIYDIRGNIATKIDENGYTITYNHDNLNRLYQVIDAKKGVWYTYDKRDNLISVMVAGISTTTYNYDNLNRLVSTASPDTGTTTYSYDPNGNMTSKTDANNITITYGYDALNRQTAIQFPDTTQNINYYYDDPQNQNSKGRLTAMTDPSGTTWYDYDKMGRVVMETKQINNLNYRTEYTYDLNGNIAAITYPGGRKITYAYNQLNKVTSVTETYLGVTRTLASNIAYQPFGDIISMMYGNGIVTTKTYNNRYQLNNLAIGTLKNLTYTRDNAGNITVITDNLNPSKTKTHTYDRIYSLVGASGYQQGNISYGYNSMGNRITEVVFTGTTYYNYSGNRLTSTTGLKTFNFSYDNNGNTTAENTRQYIYNQNQRLIRVADTTGTVAEYIYNGNGQRADKLISSQNKCTVFHYDQNGLLITESTRTGNIKAEYVYLNGQPLAKIEGNAIYYYHNDHLGTPALMTDSSGSVVWQGEFLPFGESLSVTGSITNNLRFPGQYYDSETGLYQNGYRDYYDKLGRYVEADPIGLLGGINLFTYVENNPVNFSDPTGLKVYSCCRNVQVNTVVNATASTFSYQHCFIKTDTVEAGMGPANGDPLPSCPIGIDTKITDHSGQSACTVCHNGQAGFPTCTEVPDVDEDCVNKELQVGKKTGRWWPWNNCNTVADNILKKCKKKCHGASGSW